MLVINPELFQWMKQDSKIDSGLQPISMKVIMAGAIKHSNIALSHAEYVKGER